VCCRQFAVLCDDAELSKIHLCYGSIDVELPQACPASMVKQCSWVLGQSLRNKLADSSVEAMMFVRTNVTLLGDISV